MEKKVWVAVDWSGKSAYVFAEGGDTIIISLNRDNELTLEQASFEEPLSTDPAEWNQIKCLGEWD